MSMTKELIDRLRQHADTFAKSGFAVDGLVKDYREAADTIQLLSEKLHASQMEQKWIPISERLPMKCTQVLCCNKYGSVFTSELTWSKGYLMFGQHSNVIAWMPLPEPFKAERR